MLIYIKEQNLILNTDDISYVEPMEDPEVITAQFEEREYKNPKIRCIVYMKTNNKKITLHTDVFELYKLISMNT